MDSETCLATFAANRRAVARFTTNESNPSCIKSGSVSQVSVVAESSEWFFFLQKICTCCTFCLGLRQTCFATSDFIRGAQHRCSTRFVAISCFYCLFTIGFGMKNLIYVRKRTVAVDLRCSKTSFKLAIDRSFAFMLNK